MPVVSSFAGVSGRSLGWGSLAEITDGAIIMSPTSIVKAGTGSTATINPNGSVDFSTCTSLSLNGVFTSNYENYIISIRHVSTDNDQILRFRLRTNGSDAQAASDYVYQRLYADGATVSALRSSADTFSLIAASDNDQRSGSHISLFRPFLTQPTVGRSSSTSGYLSALIYDSVFTHDLSTSYDGFTIYPNTGSISGALTVYGLD